MKINDKYGIFTSSIEYADMHENVRINKAKVDESIGKKI